MGIQLRIESRNVALPPAISRRIERKAAKLERTFERITDCRIAIDGPSQRRKGAEFNVRIDVSVPGKNIVVDRHHSTSLEIAVRDAFSAARRRLEDFAHRRRNDVKHHDAPSRGHIIRILGDQGYGFIHLADGREVYFHRNSLLGGSFEDLRVGDRVRFREERGDNGPQASSVTLA